MLAARAVRVDAIADRIDRDAGRDCDQPAADTDDGIIDNLVRQRVDADGPVGRDRDPVADRGRRIVLNRADIYGARDTAERGDAERAVERDNARAVTRGDVHILVGGCRSATLVDQRTVADAGPRRCLNLRNRDCAGDASVEPAGSGEG